jgi:NAD(P)-dependent dehydrogenase (short-subunit alcohol dehydrogenase family)
MNRILQDKNIFILGVGSDIGARLAMRFAAQGAHVVGTYRSEGSVAELRSHGEIHIIPCDVTSPESVSRAVTAYGELQQPWDIFISCVGVLEPIGRFFSLGFDEWEDSVRVNSLAQLRVLHALHPHRRPQSVNHAILFAGGGTNSPFRNYSAYCLGKIMLIKMCELLDDEDPELNTVILGTGWVNTRIHRQTLRNQAAAGSNYTRTTEFLRTPEKGTSFADIFACIEWCIRSGRELVGGRNFSVVHDAWREGGAELLAELRQDVNKFKLRRHGNT